MRRVSGAPHPAAPRGPARGEPARDAIDDVPLARKLAALSAPETHAPRAERVEAVETHMAWVFLAGPRALKLRKPVVDRRYDLSTVASRRRAAEREFALNKPLGGRVYRGVIPLVASPGGELRIGGRGPAADWLVDMTRLPERDSVAARIAGGTLARPDIERAVAALTLFYGTVLPEPLSGEDYRAALASQLSRIRSELLRAGASLAGDGVREAADRPLEALARDPEVFRDRARAGAVVDGHGDLRPEHVFIRPVPAIIDCLEFDRGLRILDPLSELSFFAVECERLGAAWAGALALEIYMDLTGDRPPPRLIAYYRAHHALTRAAVALWHVESPRGREPDRHRARAGRYIDLALGARVDRAFAGRGAAR